MEYKVIKHFVDLQDNNRPYYVGDIYPREGLNPTAERIAELSSSENKQHTPLIKAEKVEKAEETEEVKKPATKRNAKK